ncbi:MAG: glycosyltransferase [Pseudomonadota bacterium]
MSKAGKILVVNPGLHVIAGGQGVTAWVLQTLVDAGYSVSFATLWEPDFDLMNTAFTTRIGPDCLRIEIAPERYRAFIRSFPTRGAALELALTERFTANLYRQHHYDLMIGMNNEINFPVSGLQYIHYPRFLPVRARDDYRWFHYIPGFLPLYRLAARRLSGFSEHTWRSNKSLLNSAYIASLFDGAGKVLYPPAIGTFRPQPWVQRKNRFVIVGRLHEGKRIVPMMLILRAVRRLAGIEPFEAVFVGWFNCSPEYQHDIEALLKECPWISLRHDLDRAALTDLLSSSRFGLHGMHGEHFGMAVAEMQEAGMIVFAPNSGGPREILCWDQRRLYDSDDDAVAKIAAVLRNPALQNEIHGQVEAEAGRFLVEPFCTSFLNAVQQCMPSTAGMKF